MHSSTVLISWSTLPSYLSPWCKKDTTTYTFIAIKHDEWNVSQDCSSCKCHRQLQQPLIRYYTASWSAVDCADYSSIFHYKRCSAYTWRFMDTKINIYILSTFPKLHNLPIILTVISAPSILSTWINLHLKSTIYRHDLRKCDTILATLHNWWSHQHGLSTSSWIINDLASSNNDTG